MNVKIRKKNVVLTVLCEAYVYVKGGVDGEAPLILV